jgi:antitoxin (DNA-binding transcriptional repressor) of toxin-antitoxin stability system
MATVNVLMAKTTLSKLIESIESGREDEIVIARHGHPVARLVPVHRQPVGRRIGIAKGAFDVVPDAAFDATVARLFRPAKR